MSHLEKNSSLGVDRKTKEKLRKGEYPIDLKLDLHGFFIQDAYEELVSAIEMAYNSGLRCLLIVTGKGLHSKNPERSLKTQVPKWLAEPRISNKMIMYTDAHKKHGGSGALYILLKRNKY